jgi:hypothetical protein
MPKPRKTNKTYMPSEYEMMCYVWVVKNLKIGLSIESYPKGGFLLVRCELDDSGGCKTNTIVYKRKDLDKKDTPSNRIIYASMNDAYIEMFNLYKTIYEKNKYITRG